MGKWEKVRDRVLSGSSDKNIRFDDLCGLLARLGFHERVVGSHHVFKREGVPYRPNLQPRGSQAKPNQVAQIREMLIDFGLDQEDL
ncbi:MAG: type II toxin-antitoxin system HicA family toxin [Rubrobacter sp.]|nr:type II toxin-antitoxin system HicA family toxin [Rubrobacter sp.]